MCEEHGLAEYMDEEKICWFYHGWGYDIDMTEQKLLESHEYMIKNRTYNIPDAWV